MIRFPSQLQATIHRTTLPVLVVVAGAIILLGRADGTVFDRMRTTIADTFAPALAALSRPIAAASDLLDRARGVFVIYQENRRLTEENRRLLQWQETALRLAADNRQLRGLVKAVPEAAVSYVSARIIANSGGAFVRSVMINAGRTEGLARGQVALSGGGLVGRLTEVGDRAARVLLITDLNSRIPVIVETTGANAVLAGDNSNRPRLFHPDMPDGIRIGDRIVTSGEGGVFPPGVAVGVVTAIDHGGPRVAPYAELSRLGSVLVADYGLAEALPRPLPVARYRGPTGRGAAGNEASLR